MSRLKRLLQEVHQRSIWQLLASYIVGAWLVLQIAETLASLIGLPSWFGAGVIALLAFGLVLVLTTSLLQIILTYGSYPDRSYSWLRRLFSWKNVLMAGLIGLVVLVVGTGGYMGLRAMGIGPMGSLLAKGVLEQRERIILADFENHTTDSLLAVVLTEALRVDLAQSPSVTLVPPETVAAALQRIEREPGTYLTPQLARELAVREGVKAVLIGDVGAAGSGFVLSARLVSPTDGTELVARREVAEDSTEIIDALDRLSNRVRERIGESLRSIAQSDPLPRVTTPSLQALRRYALGNRAYLKDGDYDRAVSLYEEAISLDSTFAMAYVALGNLLNMMGQERTLVVVALQKAFDLQQELPDRERYGMLAMYHRLVTRDRDKAIDAYRSLLDINPFDLSALNNLALHNAELGNYASAEELLVRVIETDSSKSIAYMNAIEMQVAQGKFVEAESTLQALMNKSPENADIYDYAAGLAVARGDYDAAETGYRTLRDKYKGSVYWQVYAGSQLSRVARLRGKIRQAERHLREVLAVQAEQGMSAGYLESTMAIAELRRILQRAQDDELRQVRLALKRYPLDSIAPLDRPYLRLAEFFALAGDSATAREMLDGYAAVQPDAVPSPDNPSWHRALGTLALAGGRLSEAINELKKAYDVWCPICSLPLLARAYEAGGQQDSAIATYERYVATPWFYRALESHSRYMADAYEWLGDSYEERGDTAKAIRYHGKLVELWTDADPEQQPRVEAARRAMEALSSDG